MEKTAKRRKKWWIVLLVVVLVAAAAFLWATGRIPVLSAFRSEGNQKEELPTAEVITGSIEVITEGSGSVEAASTAAVFLKYGGKFTSIPVEVGDQVKRGQVLAEYDLDALDAVIENKEAELEDLNNNISQQSKSGSLSVTSPISGRIKKIYAEEDDVVSDITERYGGLAEISADNKLKVEFDLQENKQSSVHIGEEVRVEVDGHTQKGTVALLEEKKICVTISDEGKYDLGESAVVTSRSGEKLGSGVLASNHPYLVRFDYGIIDDVRVEENESVYSGTVLFTLRDRDYNEKYLSLLDDRQELLQDLQDLKACKKNPVVLSEYDGYVKTLNVEEGIVYDKDQKFCTIADVTTLKLKVDIDELDIDGIEAGQTAKIVFDAFEEETYEGTVEKISGAGNNSGGVTNYAVTISLAGNNHLKDAMSATAFIRTAGKDNVLLVPVDAIESEDGEKYVHVVKNGETEKRIIRIGLINNEYAEVTEGLNTSEQVLLPQNGYLLPIYSSGNNGLFASGRNRQ
ncbi:MAG: HlyD family efflux transporter periplasmic adaptor subunit [Oscillospiraceae bacterium]|nr:HlyD family efflux transporter periplasmic adaptor subunit [Oscillospiraceae bacterium]